MSKTTFLAIAAPLAAMAFISCGEHSSNSFMDETSSHNNFLEGYANDSGYSALVGKGNDINNYRTVKIGEQTWMAENLDYPVEGSKCHDNEPYYCKKYGRLYNGWAALDIPSACYFGNCDSQVQTMHQGICPDGWHIPRDWEWDILIAFVHSDNNLPAFYYEDSPYAGKYLKAKDGWKSFPGIVNEDKYGFAALPGGDDSGRIGGTGSTGTWWSATMYSHTIGSSYSMYDDEDSVDWHESNRYSDKFYSVRCLKD
jgi:uncharacterized protein (TIGR02145 family)